MPASDWNELIRAVRYHFATARIPRADQHVWPLYKADLEAWEAYLLVVLNGASGHTLIMAAHHLSTVRRYLRGEAP